MKHIQIFFSLLIFVGLMVACAGAETPTQAPAAIPTEASTQSPTETLLPPTATLEPTATLPPPTETSTPEPILAFVLTEKITYKSPWKLDVYLPTGAEKPYPTLLVYYGESGNQKSYRGLANYLAEKGYATVVVEYDLEKWQYDAPCSLAWVYASAEEYGLDPQRIALFGHWDGGLPAGFLATNEDPSPYMRRCSYALPESYQVRGVVTWEAVFCARGGVCSMRIHSGSAVASLCGISDDAAAEMWEVLNATLPQDWSDAIGEFDEDVQKCARLFPSYYLDGSEPPFLFLALPDPDTGLEARNFAADIQAIGGEAEVIIFDDAQFDDIKNPRSPGFSLIVEEIEAFLAEIFAE